MIVNIDILDWQSISALGISRPAIWEHYLQTQSLLTLKAFKDAWVWQGALSEAAEDSLQAFIQEFPLVKKMDRSVQMACYSAHCLASANQIDANCGVNAGSSRGATGKLEEAIHKFQQSGVTPVQTSPLTTAGNVASNVAQFIGAQGAAVSHSITCSTFMHGLLNAVAWLKAGFSEQFVLSGTEAPLTNFTLTQMHMLGIYSKASTEEKYPSQPLNFGKKTNTMVLGEGALSMLLGSNAATRKGRIVSIGYAREMVNSAAAISKEGKCIEQAMEMALEGLDKKLVSAIIAHAPGTYNGDLAEQEAIKKVFGDSVPPCTSNKWKLGHTFGASGGFSMEWLY